jgi:hypothetical protein
VGFDNIVKEEKGENSSSHPGMNRGLSRLMVGRRPTPTYDDIILNIFYILDLRSLDGYILGIDQ